MVCVYRLSLALFCGNIELTCYEFKPNHRKTKDPAIIAEREALFAELKPIYHLRFAIERQFAWEDKYRRLVVRYEKKQLIARGWRLLAAPLVNFRECFGRKT